MSKDNDNKPGAGDADKAPAGEKPKPQPVGRSVLPPSSADRPQNAAPNQAAGEPERVGGKLTRRGMEQAIAQGGSVTLGGRVYSNAADLPTQEQIDGHNAATAQTNADLAAQNKPK